MVKIGVLGKRGLDYAAGMRSVGGVTVSAFADQDPSTHHLALKHGIDRFLPSMEALADGCDAIVVATPMPLHAPQAVAALDAGIHVLSEVTAAVSVEQCEGLYRSARRSKAIYAFAENYCYFEENLIVRELAGQGFFGELYYGEGDYVHEVRSLHRDAAGEPTWRTQWQVGLRGNTYCTHELGPLMRWFRAVDTGIRIESVACFGTGAHAVPALNHDDGTLTMVKLSNGGLLKLRLDMVSNRPHRIAYEIQGVLGAYAGADEHRIWLGQNEPVAMDEPPRKWRPVRDHFDDLPQALRDEITDAKSSGHGGGDYFVGRRFAQALVGERPVEIGIEDALEWTTVGLLSQQSIAQGGRVVPMQYVGLQE